MTTEQLNEIVDQVEQIVEASGCECDAMWDLEELLKAARLNQGRDELRLARAAGKVSA